MKARKVAMFKVLMGLFMLAMVFVVTPQQAQAFTLDVYNPYPENLSVSLVYYNDEHATWEVQGWYIVSPNSTRNMEFKKSTMRNSIYIYAYTSKHAWTGADYDESILHTVISDAFEYYIPQFQCPKGPNRRQESFRRWYLDENSYLYWTPAEG